MKNKKKTKTNFSWNNSEEFNLMKFTRVFCILCDDYEFMTFIYKNTLYIHTYITEGCYFDFDIIV